MRWMLRAIDLCRSVGDLTPTERRFATEVEADCRLKLSTIWIELRDYPQACALAEHGLALAEANGDRMQSARAQSYFAMALENAGRFEASYHRRVLMLELARANGNRHQEHIALNNLSCTLLYLGAYDRALEYAHASLRVSGDWMRNSYDTANTYHTLSWIACRAGHYELALETAQQSLALARTTGISQLLTLPLLALGDALYELQHYDEALVSFREVLAIGPQNRMAQPAAVALAGIARCGLAQGSHSDARAAVDQVLRGIDMLSLGSLWEPLRVAATCFEVLSVESDPRAVAVLRAAAAAIEQQADAILDAERRRMFREVVAAHRTILLATAHT